MQTLETLKRKIGSAEDLESVVRTMKTLAAVSIRQYETAVASLADYYATIEEGLKMVLWQARDLSPPGMPAGTGETGVVVFGSDQGMCGQFNEQIVNYAREGMSAAGDQGDRDCLAVGARISERLEDAGIRVDHELPAPGSAAGITGLVQDILLAIDDWRSRRKLERVVLFYNRRRTASSYMPHHWQLLPIDPERIEPLKERRWPSRTLPAFTMQRGRLFSVLIRQYLFVSLFRACAESAAGENASRIASMHAAERNISDRLTELRSEYNQQRQTSITEELLDVVSGFEALTQAERE